MSTSRAETKAKEELEAALADNGARILLFRQLAAYEEANTFIEWCQRWNADPHDIGAREWWSNLNLLYLLAWQRLGNDQFWSYMRLGANGLRLLGRAS